MHELTKRIVDRFSDIEDEWKAADELEGIVVKFFKDLKEHPSMADNGLSSDEITLFAKELEDKLNKFDSFFQIPDETLDKVTKLYDRLCAFDKLNYELRNFAELHESYKKCVEAIGSEEKFKEVMRDVSKFAELIEQIDSDD